MELAALNKEQIRLILDELPRQIRLSGDQHAARLPCGFHIGGGASLASRELRDVTGDVDVYVTDKNNNAWNICADMPGLIERTSAALGFYTQGAPGQPYNFHDKDTPQQWAPGETAAMREFFFDPAPASLAHNPDCTVWLAKREFVLLQKLNIMLNHGDYAFRGEAGKLMQDKTDARHLCKSLGITGADALDRAVKDVVTLTEGRYPQLLARFAAALHAHIGEGGDMQNVWRLIHNDPTAQPPLDVHAAPSRGGGGDAVSKIKVARHAAIA